MIYVVSWEEERVERCLREIAEKREKNLFVWTVTQGIVKSGVEPQQTKVGGGNTADPLAALDAVIQQVQPAIYLFKDFHRFTVDDRCNLTVIRRLRDVAYHLRDTYKSLVIVAPSLKISQELAKDVTVVEFGLPRIEDFDQLLDRIIDDVKDNPQVQIDLNADARERLLHAAGGLTLKEAENVFAKTLVLDGKLDADDVSVIFSEKQQIIKKSGLLEYYEATEDFSHVAGLDNLKQWLIKRRIAFTDRAARFGLSSPRGVMLLGVQGCGKSLCAKAVASLWNLPLAAIRRGADVQQPGRLQRRERPPRDPDRRERRPGHPLDRRNRQGVGRLGRLGRERRRHVDARVRHDLDLALGEDVSGVRDLHRQRDRPPAAGTAAQGPLGRDLLRRPAQRQRAGGNPADSPQEAVARSGQVRPGGPGPRKRRLQRRRNRGGDYFGPVRCLQRAGGTLDRTDPKEPGRDGAAVEDHERGDEPAEELGQRPGTAGVHKTSAGQRRRCPKDRVLI